MSPDQRIELARYTAGITRSRRAYDETRLLADDLCVACQEKPKDGKHHKCWKCRKEETTP